MGYFYYHCNCNLLGLYCTVAWSCNPAILGGQEAGSVLLSAQGPLIKRAFVQTVIEITTLWTLCPPPPYLPIGGGGGCIWILEEKKFGQTLISLNMRCRKQWIHHTRIYVCLHVIRHLKLMDWKSTVQVVSPWVSHDKKTFCIEKQCDQEYNIPMYTLHTTQYTVVMYNRNRIRKFQL